MSFVLFLLQSVRLDFLCNFPQLKILDKFSTIFFIETIGYMPQNKFVWKVAFPFLHFLNGCLKMPTRLLCHHLLSGSPSCSPPAAACQPRWWRDRGGSTSASRCCCRAARRRGRGAGSTSGPTQDNTRISKSRSMFLSFPLNQMLVSINHLV